MNTKPQKYLIDVIPLVRLSVVSQAFFSYLHEQPLSQGTLVAISFAGRNIEGIVLRYRPDFPRHGGFRLKTIDKILEENFLTKEQLTLAQFMSDYYLFPLGALLKNFIPKRVQMRKKPNWPSSLSSKKIFLTSEQKKAVQIISKEYNKPYLLMGPASSGKTEVYIKAIKNLKKEEQALVLVPELILTSQAIEKYQEHFTKGRGSALRPKEIALLHSKISKGQLYHYWKGIKNGKIKLIIGTRLAIFYPFHKLKLIIIDEEQDISFKQWDMSPRYDARKVVEKLAKIHESKLIFGSATPRLESYYNAQKNKYQLLKIPHLKKQKLAKIILVDMKKERWNKNYSPISKLLKYTIEDTLKQKKQIIIFINRQGMSAFSVCEKCKTVLRCPKCDRALIYNNQGFYNCLHCSYETSIFPKCSACQGEQFKNIGLGTQKIEREASKLFPQARIARLDSEIIKRNQKKYQEIYKLFSQKKIDILIGTQMITKGWDLPNVSLTAIINLDDMLSLPDFRIQEKTFQNILQAVGRSERIGANQQGKAIIQTFNPESFLAKAIEKRDFNLLYKTEIEERKNLKYPPFSRLINLIFQHQSLEKTEKETIKVYKKIKNFIQKEKLEKNIYIYPPQSPLVHKSRGRYRKQILIKIISPKDKLNATLENILKKLSHGWIIDIDPISII